MRSLKPITTKLKRFKLQKPLTIVLKIVLLLLLFDVLVAALGNFYLGENAGILLGKSIKVNLSDLLFIEGAVILAIGTFIEVAKAWGEKPSPETTAEVTENVKQIQKRIHVGVLLLIVGAILIGLSIMVGTLLP